ncbi:MAG: fasciclin domain-containing protein [Pseudomonadota bacterium]
MIPMNFRSVKSLRRAAVALAVALPVAVGAVAAQAGGHSKDIVDTAAGAKNLSTLVKLVKAAGLVDTLKGKGPFTVFAPDNAAFDKLPKKVVTMLLDPKNKAALQSVLTYHVLSGKVMAGDIAGKQMMAKSVQGAKIDVNAKDGVSVNGAKVTTANIATSNGVVHIIDTVILPPKMRGSF